MAESGEDAVIGLVLDGYEILRPLGAGGMGVVYEARHQGLGRRAAVKVLQGAAGRSAEASKRFRIEAQAVNAVRHPGLVDVFGFGELPNGDLYLVMEYLEGRTFEAVVAERAPLPLGEALALTAELLDAVAAVHARGIVHRDLKPANVFLVEPPGARPYVKVLDFGIAKLLDAAGFVSVHTRTASVMGTPLYMSPEQARAEAASPASDLYSVGLILFELLSGRRAFEAANPARVMWMHVHEPPPFAADTNLRVPAEVDDLLQWLLAKGAKNRPPSAVFVAERLRALAASLGGADEPAGQAPSRAVATPALSARAMEEALTRTVSPELRDAASGPSPGAAAPFGPQALEAARQRSREGRRRAGAAVSELDPEAEQREVEGVAEGQPEKHGPRRDGAKAHSVRLPMAIAAGVAAGVVAATVSALIIASRGGELERGRRPEQGRVDAGRRPPTEDEVRQRLLEVAAAALEDSRTGARGGAWQPEAGDAGVGGTCANKAGHEDLCVDEHWGRYVVGGVVPLTGVASAPCGVAGVELVLTLRDRKRVCGSIPVAAAASPPGQAYERCPGKRGTVFAADLDLSRLPRALGQLGVSLRVVDAKGRRGTAKALKFVLDGLSRGRGDAGQPTLTDAMPVVHSEHVHLAGVRRDGARLFLHVRWSGHARDFGSAFLSSTAIDDFVPPSDDATTDALLSRLCDPLLMRADPPAHRVMGSGAAAMPPTIALPHESTASPELLVSGTTMLRGQVVAATPSLGLAAALGRRRGDAGFEIEPLVGQVPTSLRPGDGGAPYVFDFAAPLDAEDVSLEGDGVWLLARDGRGDVAEARVAVRAVRFPDLAVVGGDDVRFDTGRFERAEVPSTFWLRGVRARASSFDVRFAWSDALQRFATMEVVPRPAAERPEETAPRPGWTAVGGDAPVSSALVRRRSGRVSAGAVAFYSDDERAERARTLVLVGGRRVGELRGAMRSVALANLDGDGAVDLAGVSLDGRVLVSLDRRRWRPVAAPNPAGAGQVVAADLDGDGLDELACVSGEGRVLVTKDRLKWSLAGEGPAKQLLAADFDQDGRDELVELHELGLVRLLLSAPFDPTPVSPPTWKALWAMGASIERGDLDADQQPDLLVRTAGGSVWVNKVAISTVRPPNSASSVEFGQMKGPALEQVIVAQAESSGRVHVVGLFNAGQQVVVATDPRNLRPGPVPPVPFTDLAAAVLDGSGRAALLGFGEEGGVWVSREYRDFRRDPKLSAALCPQGKGPCRVRVAVR